MPAANIEFFKCWVQNLLGKVLPMECTWNAMHYTAWIHKKQTSVEPRGSPVCIMKPLMTRWNTCPL